MPQAHLQGMLNTGHVCFPPVPAVQGAGTVFVGGIPWVVEGSMYAPHTCGDPPGHVGALAKGSSTVFAEGKGVARLGDPVSCGANAMQVFPTVTAGG
jgi:uncharacterized Zn-binding protein involved in type VI secretion